MFFKKPYKYKFKYDYPGTLSKSKAFVVANTRTAYADALRNELNAVRRELDRFNRSKTYRGDKKGVK